MSETKIDMPPDDLSTLFVRAPVGAVLSEDRQYRYFLWRILDPRKRPLNFIGLNPSTADERHNDHTIRRCIHYATAWGFGAVFMTNIFAFRSTYPSEMLKAADPIGKVNDYWLNEVAAASERVIVCWGKYGGNRAEMVLARFYYRAHHFGLNKDGTPKHPARLPNGLQPIPFKEQ